MSSTRNEEFKLEIDTAHTASLIAARKAVREIIDECVPLVIDVVDRQRFWELLAEEAAANVGCVVKPDALPDRREAMTTHEAIEFEKTEIPWGAHAGKRVGDVEPRYFLAITEGKFSRQLKRYILSQRFQDRQELRQPRKKDDEPE